MKGVKMLRTASATLSCPEDRRVFIQIDGEPAGYLPAEVRIVPDALTLLVPPGYGG
jgi:diacylglycerol kinase family enzyme